MALSVYSAPEDDRSCRQQLTALSHELRTALQAMQLIADELGHSPLTERQRQLTDALGAAVADALATTNGQLAAPGSVDADAAYPFAQGHPIGLIEQQVAIARPAAEAKELQLITELPHSESFQPFPASQVIEALTLIARNLINNGVAYTSTGHVRVTCQLGSEILLTVSDTGVGFSPSDRERIFARGVRLRCPSAPPWDQSGGFGLYLAREAAQACGGVIEAHSDGHSGATFRAVLPFAPKGVILLADDAASIRELLTMQLSEEGYSVVAVADGGEALAAAKMRRYAAIVLDGEMPVMSGCQAAFAIRAWHRSKGSTCPPFIALTGAEGAAPSAGIHGDSLWGLQWQKPVGRDELFEGLAALVDQGARV